MNKTQKDKVNFVSYKQALPFSTTGCSGEEYVEDLNMKYF
jgi:hypothetical protein